MCIYGQLWCPHFLVFKVFFFYSLGPSGLQPVVKAAPITVHDSDSEDDDDVVGRRSECGTSENYPLEGNKDEQIAEAQDNTISE